MRYDDGWTVREARQGYFDRNGFDTSGYTDRWVRLPAGPLAVYLPNLKGRKKCIAIHDLDHVATEYDTDWRGELQIAGFEIGVGCGRYWFGWMVNSQGIALGVLLYPRDVFRAYVRGRRCTMSLFSLRHVDDAVLDKDGGSAPGGDGTRPGRGHLRVGGTRPLRGERLAGVRRQQRAARGYRIPVLLGRDLKDRQRVRRPARVE